MPVCSRPQSALVVEIDALVLHTIRLCETDNIGFSTSFGISDPFPWHNASVQFDNKLNTVCGSLHGPVAMRRRKLMIGLGALTAGGSAAFGTEAFTSVEAQRNVDVTVAGDQSAFVAIEKLSSDNAGKYVSTEGDDTVQLNFDGDNEGPGGGVSQDAITQVEDLFRVVNQGSQPSSVYFEDSSDAVTFRVTQSTDTSTTGSSGQTLEGADNSVELAVGEQVVVGMTIDTMNHDVSGDLLDNVTLYAEADASAPGQSIPEPQYVVTADPTEDNEFGSIQPAIDAINTGTEDQTGTVIGVEGGLTLQPGSLINVNVNDVTLTGFDGTPTVDGTVDFPGTDTAENLIEVSASGVTIQNLELTVDAEGGPTLQQGVLVSGDNATVDGLEITSPSDQTGNPLLKLQAQDPTVTNCNLTDGPIAAGKQAVGNITIAGNYIDGASDEGIWGYGQNSNGATKNFVIENNQVEKHDLNNNGSAQIKIGVNGAPNEINGETGKESQLNAILEANDVKTAQVDGNIDTIGGGGITANFLGADYTENFGGFSPISTNKAISTAINANNSNSPDNDAELQIHGSTGGIEQGVDLSDDGDQFKAILDPGNNAVQLEVGGQQVTDEDVTDVETDDGTPLKDDLEFPDGVPSAVDIAVSLSSQDGTVRVDDLSVSGDNTSVSGYKMASTSGDRKVFEFVNVPSAGTVTIEGTITVEEGQSSTVFGIDFADPTETPDSLTSDDDPR